MDAKLLLVAMCIVCVFMAGCTSTPTSTDSDNNIKLTETSIEQPKFNIGDVVHTSNTDGFLITAHDNEKEQYEVLTVTKYNDEWGFFSDQLYVLHMSYKKDNDDFYFVEEHFEIVDKDDALAKLPVHPITVVDTL